MERVAPPRREALRCRADAVSSPAGRTDLVDPGICRWGILGTAGIARKNWQAIGRAGNAAVTVVGSRSLDRSRRFVAECQTACPLPSTPAAVGSYDELLARTDVDAVYIPLPTGLRKEWVIRAAEAGKHVLVEKPVGVTADDVRDMISACCSA